MALDQVKKGGPYPKTEQRKRREEVYRLHFDYGYSARKIAEFLQVNRGTINRDIMYWFNSISNKWRHFDPMTHYIRQAEKFEIQKIRLRKQLDNTESFREKMAIEKFIFDIDVKICNFQIRVAETRRNVYGEAEKIANETLQIRKEKNRVLSKEIFLEVTAKAHERIWKIINEDIKF